MSGEWLVFIGGETDVRGNVIELDVTLDGIDDQDRISVKLAREVGTALLAAADWLEARQ